MSFDPITGGPCWVADIRRGALRQINQVLLDHEKWKTKMTEFKQYRRTQIAEMTPWVEGFDMKSVSLTDADRANGSPKLGDWIARNPKNHDDRWLVAAQYFSENFESM